MERIFYILLILFALVLLFHSWLLVSLSMKNRELEKRVHQLQRKSGPQLRNQGQRELLQKQLLVNNGERMHLEQQKKRKRTRQR